MLGRTLRHVRRCAQPAWRHVAAASSSLNSRRETAPWLALAGGAAALACYHGPGIVHGSVDDSGLTAEETRTVEIFEHSSRSVVHINTFVEVPVRQRGFRFNLQEVPQGTGSGFVWDSQHIVTNYHVIKDANRASVVLSDHTTMSAVLVGVEPECDIAVLRIDGPEKVPLQPLDRGSSSGLRVGQKVLAIGNPFGLDQTLTSGIISGLSREMRGVSGRTIRGLVQTDAAINPGNSGGPLLDGRGRLIGVNTMIASPSGAFAGVGFAIPVDTVVRVVQQLIRYGHTKHPLLGIRLLPDHVKKNISSKLVSNGWPALQGNLVLEVEPGTPACSLGLKPIARTDRGLELGDEIISLAGKPVHNVEGLLDVIDEQAIGEEVDITYRRHLPSSTELRKATVRLGERSGARAVQMPLAHGDKGVLVREVDRPAQRVQP